MPGVSEHPPIPSTSTCGTPTLRNTVDRHRAGATPDNNLQEGADDASGCHHIHPGYSPTVIDTLARLAPRPQVIADIDVGTGEFTASLADVYRDVTLLALDPPAAMRQALMHDVPAVECLDGTVERMRLESDSVDVVTCAQTRRWVDLTAVSRELARVLHADDVTVLVWSALDVPVPWVHRLGRIMYAGGVLCPSSYPEVGPKLGSVDGACLAWEQALTIEDTVLPARTYSYWPRFKPTTRAKVGANSHWYLHEHLGHAYEEGIALPHQYDAFYFQAA